jgi:hypothetical protein
MIFATAHIPVHKYIGSNFCHDMYIDDKTYTHTHTYTQEPTLFGLFTWPHELTRYVPLHMITHELTRYVPLRMITHELTR